MKCTIDFECSPLEARQFFGLPDVQPLQAKVLAELERKMLAEMERFSPDGVLKSWFSMYVQAPEQMREALTAMMSGMTRAKS